MPFLGYNPKILKCYDKLSEPVTDIPATDDTAWTHFKNERWVYNKLNVALSQNIECGPIGVKPSFDNLITAPLILSVK